MMKLTKVLATVLLLAMLVFVQAGQLHGQIIVPTAVSTTDLNAYGGTGTDQLIDNSGMTPPVNAGDSVESALEATHIYPGGFSHSYVSNASGADYFTGFGASNPPIIVWDLTGGGDVSVGMLILWQYENNGGDGTSIGNQVRTIELSFNTEAEGAETFNGPAISCHFKTSLSFDNTCPAQVVEFPSGQYRYVQMKITDNHAGDPDGEGVTGGGDRVGIGEIRFASVLGSTNPNPVNAASNVPIDTSLSWGVTSGVDVKGYDVYFGTDPNVSQNPKVVDGENVTTYTPPSNLNHDTTYYWKVDVIQTNDEVLGGSTWHFTTIPAIPVIEENPQDVTVPVDGTASFTVSALNQTEFEWYKSTDPCNSTPADDVALGVDSDTLTISNVQLADEGFYYCVASNSVGSVSSQPAMLITERLVAQWLFENNLQDELGDHNGQPFALDPNFSDFDYAPGKVDFGMAIVLPGDSNAVQVPYSPALNTASFTISFWANVDADSSGYRAAVSNRDDLPQRGFIIYATAGDKWEFWTGTGSGWQATRSGGEITNVVSGEWVNVVASFEATGRNGNQIVGNKSLYINGSLAAQNANVTYLQNTVQELLIGAGANESETHDFFFGGLIDDVQMWDYALDPITIAHLYTDITNQTVCVDNQGLQYDFNGNCQIDLGDFALFASTWMNCRLVPDCN